MKLLLKSFAAIACACLLAIAFLAVYDSINAPAPEPEETFPRPQAVITFRRGGEMVFTLYPEYAPNTVGSFIYLANKGFYDGLDFNEVVSGAFAKGGDPAGDGTGTAGYTIAGEFRKNGHKNPLSHTRGTMSLARQEDDMNSGSCQFFILQGDFPEYDGYYAAFGTLINEEGYTLLDEMCSCAVDSNRIPIRRWFIKTIRVDTFGAEYPFEEYVDPDAEKE